MAKHRDILEQLNTAVAVVAASGDGSFRITYLNQSAQSLFGISAARAVGIPPHELLPDAQAKPAMLQAVLDTGRPFTKREVLLPAPERPATRKGASQANSRPSRTPTGRPLRISYSVAPLAERELLLEFDCLDRFMRIWLNHRHQRAQQTIRLLARNLAHEVKNPLGGIRGAAQLLDRQLARASDREHTALIIAEADRLRNLVDGILGPNGQRRFAPVNVHHVIQRVVKLLQAEHPAHIRFERSYDPSVPEVEADSEQLVQATLNVLKNAAMALAEVPRPVIQLQTRVLHQFTIGTTRHRLVVNMDFVDNGPGISPDVVDRIFFPMFSGRPGGAGLGLSITQTIIALHHGLVACESEPGRTVFSFYLPIRQPRRGKGASDAG